MSWGGVGREGAGCGGVWWGGVACSQLLTVGICLLFFLGLHSARIFMLLLAHLVCLLEVGLLLHSGWHLRTGLLIVWGHECVWG